MTDEARPSTGAGTQGAASRSGDRRWLVLNPTSGTADHIDDVRRLATEREYRIEETEGPGHAVELAQDAVAEDIDRLAVAGGDGTLNEVVRGLDRANGLDSVTFGVVPTGTANIFATNVGITGIEHGFEMLDRGERRDIDVGVAGDAPFVMSCIAGLPADASVATSGELKERFGSLAFVIAGLQEVASFDGLDIELTAVSQGEETTWQGEALSALVGNVRRFTKKGGQANVEDGLLEVVIIEQMPPSDLIEEGIAHRLFGQDTEHVVHVRASQLEIDSQSGKPIDFSLDGELSSHGRLVVHTRPHALTVCVGPEYDPDPAYE